MRLTEEQYQALMLRHGPAGMAALEAAATKPETPLQRMQALGRMKAGRMNKTEAAYAQYLEGLKVTGEVLWYEFEAMTLRLADRTRFTPDFAVLLATGELELHEVKGLMRDDAAVKLKCAAEKFPLRIVLVRKRKVKEGGGWRSEVV